MPKLLFLAAVFAGLLSGCATPWPYTPRESTKYTVENTEKFVLLDDAARLPVTCTGLQERLLPDGRLEVIANVKNREARRLEVQIQCVFKDAQGQASGAEAPWQTLVLAESSTESVRFTAQKPQAKEYAIRVRQPR